MSQGLDVEKGTAKWAGQTISVVREVARDDSHSPPAAEVIQGNAFFDSASGSAAQRSDACEIAIRALDVAGSVFVLFITGPAMLLIGLVIKVFCGGPVLYKQKRVGINGNIFILYKFRTMRNGAEDHTGPVLAAKDDFRVTRIGRVLRQTRLDELPQLFNVLRGDMSLVGPRPERPFFVKQHKTLQGVRLAVKPGLTGLAQIRSFYDLKPDHKVRYDYLYIQKRSLLLNLYILLKTIPVIFCQKGW